MDYATKNTYDSKFSLACSRRSKMTRNHPHSYAKTQLFECAVGVSFGVKTRSDFSPIEKDINEFLRVNPNIRVVDIKIASNAAPVGDSLTNYGMQALLLYEE